MKEKILTLLNFDYIYKNILNPIQTHLLSLAQTVSDHEDRKADKDDILSKSEVEQIAATEINKLAAVAKSGSYNDLSNKPTIPNDTNVTQINRTSYNGNYRVLFGTNTDTQTTGTVNKSSKLTFNPYTGTLNATKFSGVFLLDYKICEIVRAQSFSSQWLSSASQINGITDSEMDPNYAPVSLLKINISHKAIITSWDFDPRYRTIDYSWYNLDGVNTDSGTIRFKFLCLPKVYFGW